jgi:hypothetical protein
LAFRYECQNRGVGVFSFERFNHIRDGGRTFGPDDLHDAMFAVGERQIFLSRHVSNLSTNDLVIGE